MAKKFDVVSAVGKYQGQDGQEKTRWLKCGAVLEINGKFKLKMDAMPTGGEGWFELVKPSKIDARGAYSDGFKADNKVEEDFDDEIPF